MAKILVVDTEPNIRKFVGRYMRRDGYVAVSRQSLAET